MTSPSHQEVQLHKIKNTLTVLRLKIELAMKSRKEDALLPELLKEVDTIMTLLKK